MSNSLAVELVRRRCVWVGWHVPMIRDDLWEEWLYRFDDKKHDYDPLLDGSSEEIDAVYGHIKAFSSLTNAEKVSFGSIFVKNRSFLYSDFLVPAYEIAKSRAAKGLCDIESTRKVEIKKAYERRRDLIKKDNVQVDIPKTQDLYCENQILRDHVNRCMDMYDRDTCELKQRIVELEKQVAILKHL